MEDFSPILWVVFTVGALIFSAVSKARKEANKGTQGTTPNQPAHEEPWSWLDPETMRTTSATSQEEIPEDEGQSLEEIPSAEYESLEAPYEAPKPQTAAPQSNFENILQETSRGISSIHQHKGSTLAATPGTQWAAEKKSSLIGDDNTEECYIMAQSDAIEEIETEDVTEAEIGKPSASTHITFDLRQAVIASEILKPKFDE